MRNYELHMNRFRYFAENRQQTVVHELRQYFGLSEAETIEILVRRDAHRRSGRSTLLRQAEGKWQRKTMMF